MLCLAPAACRAVERALLIISSTVDPRLAASVCLPGLCPVLSLASPPPASRALRTLVSLAPAACRAVERARLTSCSTVDSLLSAKAHAQRPASPPPASRALRNMIALARVACLAIAARAFDLRRRQLIMRPAQPPAPSLTAACFSRPAELGRYSACSLPRPRARASAMLMHQARASEARRPRDPDEVGRASRHLNTV